MMKNGEFCVLLKVVGFVWKVLARGDAGGICICFFEIESNWNKNKFAVSGSFA